MTLTIASAATILYEHDLLREIITPDTWTMNPRDIANHDVPFTAITYDSRAISSGSLMFCKGRFQPQYLQGADDLGLACYVSESDLSAITCAPGLIVTNVSKAMSILSAAFYDYPQDELTVIGITGTKGKTTTAYMTQRLLANASNGACALFSSVDNCLDGTTFVESDLTTPESMDCFRMMREAADNGMRYLVMEVSSQAYKVNRVYGLEFDAAAFLNISPDHISPIEHPTFEDYFYCKRQIIKNTDTLILGADCMYRDLIEQDARLARTDVITFSYGDVHGDVQAKSLDEEHRRFLIDSDGVSIGECELQLVGDFNAANAAAAVALVQAVGVSVNQQDLTSLNDLRIAGRMEVFEDQHSHTVGIVDYAHNYASVTALLDYVDQRYGNQNPYITLITGSAGNKAFDRRKEIIDAAQNRVNRIIITHEDTDTESVEHICNEMFGYITNPAVDATIMLKRTDAINTAIDEARTHDDHLNILLAIGKGREAWIKDNNIHTPYEGDSQIIERRFQ